MEKLIGNKCVGIGDCGMTKDVEVSGTLHSYTKYKEAVIQDSTCRLCSVVPNTLKMLLFTTVDDLDVYENTSHTLYYIKKENCTLNTLLPYWIGTMQIFNKNHTYPNYYVFKSLNYAKDWRNKRAGMVISHPNTAINK